MEFILQLLVVWILLAVVVSALLGLVLRAHKLLDEPDEGPITHPEQKQ